MFSTMKNLIHKTVLSLLVLVGSVLGLKAETYQLDLQSSIEIAKLRSYDMLIIKQDLKIAEYNLRSATSRYKTHITMDLTAPEYTETIRQFEDTEGIAFYPVNQLAYGGNLTIRQPLPTNGNLYLRNVLNNIEDLNDRGRYTRMYTEFGLTQPIDALYGYNDIKSSLKRAELGYERSEKQLKRSELNLVYNVSNSFYNLLSLQKRQEIAKLNLERQTEAYEIAKNKYEAGLIREVDALQMEVDLAEAKNNYDLSIINQISALNSFKELIGVDLADSIVLSSELDYDVVIVDPIKAVTLAMDNRLEIREQEIQIELNKISIKAQKSQGMVSGDFNAYYQKNGISELSMNNTLGTSVSSSFDDFGVRPANFGLGFTLSIPILDWGQNKALVRAQEASLQQNIYRKEVVKREIEREIMNLVSDLNSSLKRLQLLEKNVNVAEKSFEITRLRFADGDIDSQALALERERLNNAYVSHLSAYINYQLKLADLMRKTFYDFKNDRPID